MNLSAVVLTWNEEKYIGRCLESLKVVCDDVVVVDSYSNDETDLIAETYPNVRVFNYYYKNTRDSRNFGLDQCRNEWRLIIDADEYLSSRTQEMLLNELARITSEATHVDHIELGRLNFVDGIDVEPSPEAVIHLVRRNVVHGGHPLHANRAAGGQHKARLDLAVIHDKTGLEWMQAARMYWWMCPYTFPHHLGKVVCPPGADDLEPPAENWLARQDINVWAEYIQTPAYRKLTQDGIKDLVIDAQGWHRRGA